MMAIAKTEMIPDRRKSFADVRRVVVKLGTRVVTVKDNELNEGVIARLAADVAKLRTRGIQVAVVSSGAVGAGMGRLGVLNRPQRLAELQATAAVGQGLVMNAYKMAFRKYDIPVGQVLLTSDDLDHRQRYLNAQNTLDQLFRFGAVPIVNENDSVAVEELQLSVGENDRLAALVSHLVDAQLLAILTDVDGVFSDDPSKNADAQLIPYIKGITEDLYALVGSRGSSVSRGGMRTKLQAAEIAAQGGRMTLIANGQKNGLDAILLGEDVGTLVVPDDRGLSGKEVWLAQSRRRGVVVVDDGAAKALVQGGKSLLPSGIVEVKGDFDAGDLVGIEDKHHVELARGLVRFGAGEVHLIRGKQTGDVAQILDDVQGAEVIHRDHMVVF
ncbi:MAG: glutamate 5-kinase [Candidatus Latescibacteria bacterium]|jgi:glutamate 5-kinase|nr:glutamate 5-kinase [Candidatus Latescibacterota bacterium]